MSSRHTIVKLANPINLKPFRKKLRKIIFFEKKNFLKKKMFWKKTFFFKKKMFWKKKQFLSKKHFLEATFFQIGLNFFLRSRMELLLPPKERASSRLDSALQFSTMRHVFKILATTLSAPPKKCNILGGGGSISIYLKTPNVPA